jgi:hypothetical protein
MTRIDDFLIGLACPENTTVLTFSSAMSPATIRLNQYDVLRRR